MTVHASYFSDYKTRAYTCDCGWKGAGEELASETFDELLELSCPKCERHLLLVSYPTGDEIAAAAAAGNAEAINMLDQLHEQERRAEVSERSRLKSASQLPDLVVDTLDFVWDVEPEEGEDGNRFYIISAGKQLVWRELAAWEDWERFDEVKTMLKEKYGPRFASITPTEAAKVNLLGDNLSAKLTPT